MTDPIPAATLILLRDRADAPPEVLMVERARTLAFAGGAMVFPGGRIDPGDQALAAAIDAGVDGAARIAAIRETIEEAGLAIGLDPPPSPAVVAAIRRRLHGGEAFGAILADLCLTLDLTALVPFARWLPDHAHVRVFDTLFFLARAAADASASADATETVRLLWSSAAAILRDADDGAVTLIYPTRRTLERLALFADHDAAVAQARAHPVRTITPYVESREGRDWLCIPDDCGYPVTAEPVSQAQRG